MLYGQFVAGTVKGTIYKRVGGHAHAHRRRTPLTRNAPQTTNHLHPDEAFTINYKPYLNKSLAPQQWHFLESTHCFTICKGIFIYC